MFLEIHTLTQRGISCLNRDREGKQKRGDVGGHTRVRQSPQNQRFPQRNWLLENPDLEPSMAVRTGEIPDRIVRRLIHAGRNEAEAIAAVQKAMATLRFNLKKEDTNDDYDRKVNSTTILLPLSKQEEDALYGSIAEHFDDLASDRKAASKEAATALNKFEKAGCNSLDVALYGRFIAAYSSMKVDGAVEVAHAMSVNEACLLDDFFVAICEVTKNNIGSAESTQQYGANLMYAYSNLNVKTLALNLGDDSLIPLPLAVKAYMEASIYHSTPTAKRTSSAEHHKPCFVRAIVRNAPVSACEAFSVPIKPTADEPDTRVHAIKALFRHSIDDYRACGSDVKLDLFYMTGGIEWSPSVLPDNCNDCKGFKPMIAAVERAITA